MARRLHHLLCHYGPGFRGRGCRLGHRLHYQGAGRGTSRRLGHPGSFLDVELHRIFVAMALMRGFPGPSSDAERSLPYRRQAIRRTRSKIPRSNTPSDRLRRGSDLREGNVDEHVDRRRHPDWHNALDNRYRSGHSIRDLASQIPSPGERLLVHGRCYRWTVSTLPRTRLFGPASNFYAVSVVSAPEQSPTSTWRVGDTYFGFRPLSTARRL